MRSTLSLLLCALAIACVTSQSNSSSYLIVARGIVEGMSSIKGWSDITSCLTNYDALTAGLADAIATFQPNNSATITPAAIKLGKALQKFPDALRTCNNSVLITKNLVNTISSFASLSDYVRIISSNVALYNVDLVKETAQASSLYYQVRMKEFGNKVGQAMAQVFLNGTGKVPPKPDANTTSVNTLITQGFVEGFSTGLRWNQVKACMKGTNDSQNDMNSAVQLLQSADPQTFAKGLAAFGSALVDVPTAIQDCTGAKDKATDLVNALAAIQDLATYGSIVGTNAALNGIDIYEEIYTASLDLKVGAYKDFGTQVGLAVGKLFFDNVQTARKL